MVKIEENYKIINDEFEKVNIKVIIQDAPFQDVASS